MYNYTAPVAISYNRLHSFPRELPHQISGAEGLIIEPEPAFMATKHDYFGNPVTLFTVQSSHTELSTIVMFESEVEHRKFSEPSMAWEQVIETLRKPSDLESLRASQFCFDSTSIKTLEKVTNYAKESFANQRGVLEGTQDFCSRIFREFKFDPEATQVSTPISKVFEDRRGVCQDFAQLAIAGLRGLGIATRYVSGYLLTLPPPGQEKLQGSDASHAWISVWAPPYGWVDFDPTNNCLVSDQHITLATGRDYHDVCPLRGVMLGGGEQTVKVSVDVRVVE